MPKLRGDRERYNVKVLDNFHKLERSLIPAQLNSFLLLGKIIIIWTKNNKYDMIKPLTSRKPTN